MLNYNLIVFFNFVRFYYKHLINVGEMENLINLIM